MAMVAMLVVLVTAPATGTIAAPQESREIELTLPRGTVKAGRQAFIDLRCVACHRAPDDPAADFPEPISASPGPDLGSRQAVRGAAYLATTIVLPTHEISVDPSDELVHDTEEVTSPMGDITHVMTVRQFFDLIEYLESLAPSE